MNGITRRSMVVGAIAALGALALPLAAHADEAAPQAKAAGVTLDATASSNMLTIGYPSSWMLEQSDGTGILLANPAQDFIVSATASNVDEPYAADPDAVKAAFTIVVTSSGSAYDAYIPQFMELTVDAAAATCTAFFNAEQDGSAYFGLMRICWSGTTVCVMTCMALDTFALAENKAVYDAIWDSRSCGDAVPAETAPEGAQPQEPQEMTMGQSNALQKAHDYLDFMAFSYSGLIGQLEYEGFSTEDATFAADNCGADWNAQAAAKAQEYLDFMSFSRQGLIDQLVYEGFTAEQAEYGVTAVGY